MTLGTNFTGLSLWAGRPGFPLAAMSWGGSRGGSVEPPKLNIKTYNKRVVQKKSEPTQLINISFVHKNSNKNKRLF